MTNDLSWLKSVLPTPESEQADRDAVDRSLRHMNSRYTMALGHVIDLLESFAKNPDPAAVAQDLRDRWHV